MNTKNIAVAAGTALVALCASFGAQASTLWSTTTTGTISYGFDATGLFGTAGQDLAGLSYSQTITANVDPSQWSYHYGSAASTYQYVYGAGPSFTDTVTVAGHTATFTSTTISGEQYIDSYASTYGNGNNDEVYSYQYGNTAGGDELVAYQYAYGTSPFVSNASFQQSVSSNVVNGYSVFELYGNGDYTYFQSSTPSTISASAVPEAGVPAMLFAGLAMFGFMSRRKIAKSA